MTTTVREPTRVTGVVRTGPRMANQSGVRFAIANALLLLAVPAVAPAGLLFADAALVVVAGAACVGLARHTALLTGVVAWAWCTGFVENQYGDLTFSPADLVRLLASALGALLVAVVCRHLLDAAHWSRGRPTTPR
jgi:hypothetical protein